MVDISDKSINRRRAVAEATIFFSAKAFQTLIKDGSPKGDIFETAKIAGIMAAKNTPSMIPLCHPLNLEKVNVRFEKLASKKAIKAIAYFHDFEIRGLSITRVAQSIKMNGEIEEAGKNLDLYYISARYPDALPAGAPFEFFTIAQSKKALDDANLIIQKAIAEIENG